MQHYFSNKSYLWLWIPSVFIILAIASELILPKAILTLIYDELGLIEMLQAGLLIAGFVLGIKILIQGRKTITLSLQAWIGLATICCLFVAGEELSWGQHMFEWTTPESWQTINDQQETNLHNTSSWLDQKPRLILLVGILIGGIILPLINHFKSKILPENLQIIYPTAHFAVTALMVIAIKIEDKIEKIIDVKFFQRSSELEEIYMYYFVLLYMLLMHSRLLKKTK